MKKIINAAALLILLTACDSAETVRETEVSPVQTAAEETIAAVTEIKTETVTSAPKPISPLSRSKRQSYYQNSDFSVTAEIRELRSSLYYPDIVAEMGADPELFVVETMVRVKNLAYEESDFDCAHMTLSAGGGELYLFDTQCEDAENIRSGKIANLTLRYLCSLSQAENIGGFSYCGEELDTAQELVPDAFADIIAVQSAEDVREYLYRPYVIHRSNDYYSLEFSAPAGIEAQIIGKTGENDEYFAVKYMVYNRSDYAMLIEPSGFGFKYLTDAAQQLTAAEAAFISTDEELMYKPEAADIKLKNVGRLYRMPDFICMAPEGETAFTVVYKAEGHIKKWLLEYNGTHEEEPYYCKYESIILVECDTD